MTQKQTLLQKIEKKFFRQTNLFRVVGLILIFAGAYIPGTNLIIGNNTIPTGSILVSAGVIAILAPIIKELLIIYKNGKSK